MRNIGFSTLLSTVMIQSLSAFDTMVPDAAAIKNIIATIRNIGIIAAINSLAAICK
jgi:hypothetical protein